MRGHRGLKSARHEYVLRIWIHFLQHDEGRAHIPRELHEHVSGILGGSNVPGEQASSFRFSFRPYLLFPLELNADQSSQQLSIGLHRDVLPHIEAMEVHE